MKKIISVIAVISIVFSLLSFIPVSAEGTTMNVSANYVYGKIGNTVTVTFTLSNNPGLWGIVFDVAFPSTLSVTTGTENVVTSAVNGTIFSDTEVTITYLGNNSLRFYSEGTDYTNKTANGTLCTVTFTIAPAATVGEKALTLSATGGNVINCDGTNVPYTLTNGCVYTYMLGDVNGDLRINATDALFVKRYIADTLSPTATFIFAAGDVNSDTRINATDSLKIRRYIASGTPF